MQHYQELTKPKPYQQIMEHRF